MFVLMQYCIKQPKYKMGKKSTLSKRDKQMEKLHLTKSQYSILYERYMIFEFPGVQILLKQIIKLPCCQQHYLNFPLESMLRGICKKLLMNFYQLIIYGYFLQICEWGLNQSIFGNLYELFPDIVHVNEPNNPERLKQITMFLYFSCYSIKELLNQNMELFKHQLLKVFPQFQHLHAYWVNGQPTTNFILNPKNINRFYNQLMTNDTRIIDYNTLVDKIIQISPCYDSNKPKIVHHIKFQNNFKEEQSQKSFVKRQQPEEQYPHII